MNRSQSFLFSFLSAVYLYSVCEGSFAAWQKQVDLRAQDPVTRFAELPENKQELFIMHQYQTMIKNTDFLQELAQAIKESNQQQILTSAKNILTAIVPELANPESKYALDRYTAFVYNFFVNHKQAISDTASRTYLMEYLTLLLTTSLESYWRRTGQYKLADEINRLYTPEEWKTSKLYRDVKPVSESID